MLDRYKVIEGYTDGIWYVVDTFENDKVIREFKDQRPLAYDYCVELNKKRLVKYMFMTSPHEDEEKMLLKQR